MAGTFAIDLNVNVNFTIPPALTEALAQLKTISQRMDQLMVKFDDLVAQVTKLETVQSSAVALLAGLKQKLDDALALGDPAVIQAAIKDITDRLAIDQQKLADAILANTPSAP